MPLNFPITANITPVGSWYCLSDVIDIYYDITRARDALAENIMFIIVSRNTFDALHRMDQDRLPFYHRVIEALNYEVPESCVLAQEAFTRALVRKVIVISDQVNDETAYVVSSGLKVAKINNIYRG